MASVEKEYDVSTPYWRLYYKDCKKTAQKLKKRNMEAEGIAYLIRSKWILCDPRRLAFEKFIGNLDNVEALRDICILMENDSIETKLNGLIEYMTDLGYLKREE